MSVHSFQSFITSDDQLNSQVSCLKSVNLLRLENGPQDPAAAGRGRSGGGPGARGGVPRARVALVMDAENCLDRLYGGYFSDWSCGGEWPHMVEFLATLIGTLQQSNVQMAFFFNGASEAERFPQWRSAQLKLKDNVNRVMRHLHKRATPPPKAFWVPPCAIQTMLRLALKTLNCSVLCSVEDHHQEVMGFCWENGYHGVMADDAEYAMVNPPKYLSAKALKMTFQFEVTTEEYFLDEVAKSLDLNPNRFSLLGTLLGNHILTPLDLSDFHQKLAPELKQPKNKAGFERVIRAVVNYIRALPKTDDFEQLGEDVFGSSKDPRMKRLKSSLQYYSVCSKEGYQKQQKPKHSRKKKYPGIKLPSEMETAKKVKEKKEKKVKKEKEDTQQQQQQQQEASSSKQKHAEMVERIALDLDQMDLNEAMNAAAKVMESEGSGSAASAATAAAIGPRGDGGAAAMAEEEGDEDDEEKEDAEEDDKEMSVLQALASGVEVKPSEEGKYPTKKEPVAPAPVPSVSIPDVHPDVFATALERHRQAQMSSLVYQLLTRGELKLPVVMEDLRSEAIPHVHLLYRPLRQNVYAIIFNLHHQRFNRRQIEEGVRANRRKADDLRKQAKKQKTDAEKKALTDKADTHQQAANCTKIPDKVEVIVREWLPYNDYKQPDAVEGVEVTWAVPTIQRLWFGSSVEDKEKRLRAFLSCLRCDDCPPLLSHSSVPQHMILLACVLRYIMSSPSSVILRKPELDAILATAFSQEIRNPRFLAELKVDVVTIRGVEIATMLMQGLEMALFANDACGAPIPFQMSLPWSFFDGKLFHTKLRKADTARNLMELCDGRMEVVYAVERMRAAILHGLVPQYANNGVFGMSGRGRGAAAAMGRGGQLVVGGSVVGQWAGNQGQQQQGQKKKKAKSKAANGTKSASPASKTVSRGRGVTVSTEEGSSVLASDINDATEDASEA